MYNMDKLFLAVEKRGHICVGLDTTIDYIPEKERAASGGDAASAASSVLAYNKAIIDVTCDIAACYKVQIAYYEELGIAGLQSYAATLEYLRGKGVLVIADIKRGDIADTASRYARAHFEGEFEADFVTLNPYMGMDSIQPWLQWADKKGKGAFVLVRTSNQGRRDFQELEVSDAGARSSNGRLFHSVGEKLSRLACDRLGAHGYGAFGAVVGADPQTLAEREETAAIRKQLKNLFFLIPGYGAQGGAAADAALLLHKGNGGVVNSSRAILKAWQTMAEKEGRDFSSVDNAYAAASARVAAIEMRDAILAAAR